MIGGSAAFLRYSKAAFGGFMLYGLGKFFCFAFRKVGLALRRNPLSRWLCFVLALPSSVIAYPWVKAPGIVHLRPRPERYYSEFEILQAWSDDSRFTGIVPPEARYSVSAVYSWLDSNRPDLLTPPFLCAITSTVRVVDFGESFAGSTNSLVSVSVAPSLIDRMENHLLLFPAYLSSRYGLGFFAPNSEDLFGSSPAFGGSYSWGGSLGFFTTNLTTTYPWDFQDWQEPGPLVWQRQNLSSVDFFKGSSSYFSGRLRVMSVYYSFPSIPVLGLIESDSGSFPVTRSSAYQLVDEYFLPWYWQTGSGVYLWDDGDTVKLRNVWRFHSSSTNSDGGGL